MMKKHILLFVSLLFSTSALAEDWYADAGLGFVNFDDGVDEISPTNIYIRGGYVINENFNIGIESSATISSDQISGAPGVDFDVDIFTIYVRGVIPMNNKVRLYAQLGQSNTELTGEAGGVSVSIDDNDLMIGFGAEIGLGEGTAYLALNFSSYNSSDGVDATAFNIGVGARF